MKIGDKILVARPGYYPLLVRAHVRSVTRYSLEALVSYSGEPAGRRWLKEEGITWCRGHDLHTPAADALRVVVSLSGYPHA